MARRIPDISLPLNEPVLGHKVKALFDWLKRNVPTALDSIDTMTGQIVILAAQILSVSSTANAALSAASTAQTAADAHASRHLSGAADEIDGDKLDIDHVPVNYTSTTDGAISTTTAHLTSHIKGIDLGLAGIVTSFVSLFAWQNNAISSSSGTFVQPGYTTGIAGSSEAKYQVIATRGGKLRNLYVKHGTAGTYASAVTYTVRINGVNTTLAASANGNSTTAGSDTTHSPTVVAGDLLSVIITAGGAISTPPSNIMVSFELAGA